MGLFLREEVRDNAAALAGGKVDETLCKEGQHLTFLLGNEIYGLQIPKVRKTITVLTISSIQNEPECVRRED